MAAFLNACAAEEPAPAPTPIALDLTAIARRVVAATPNVVVIAPPTLGTPRLADLLRVTAPAQPIATPTPVYTVTPTPSTTPPVPIVQVRDTPVDLRSGPGLIYEIVQQWGPGLPLQVRGRSLDSQWLQVCCIQIGTQQEDTLWVQWDSLIMIEHEKNIGRYATPIVPLTPTPTQTPLPTQTPFARAIGPEFFPTSHEFLTIWAKVYVGPPEAEEPLAGYLLAVEFRPEGQTSAQVRANQWQYNGEGQTSVNRFDYSAPPGAGNHVRYNYRYEYQSPGKGTWFIWLIDAQGRQLSAKETFTTDPNNPNREIYIGWIRVA